MTPERVTTERVTTERNTSRRMGIIRRWSEHLPVDADGPVVTLHEGDTPLIHSDRLSEEITADVWLKLEGLNPTGSFKDRGMTLAVSKAVQEGSRAVVCASTGNTSASAAAYAGRAGLICAVLIPRGNVALGKLAQALIHGARVLEIEANFDRALDLTKAMADAHPITLVNSVNPYRIEGQKTAAFEVVEGLGRAPDLHVMPVGNAGNITAYWRGYRESAELGWTSILPKMFGFQAAGAAPIVRGEVVAEPQTVATAIRIGNPVSWEGATEAASASGGEIAAVTDEEIIEAQRDLAIEGIFVELASAASIAGLRQIKRRGLVEQGTTVVCVLTGHGLKDPDWVLSGPIRPMLVAAELDPILEALAL